MSKTVIESDPGLEDVLPGEKSAGTVFHFDTCPEENDLEGFDVVI